MAWNFIVTSIRESDRYTSVFGQLLFTGNYTTGGDASGTVALDLGTNGVAGTTKNTAALPVFLGGQTNVRATRPALEQNVQIESGYAAVLVPNGTGPFTFKIKIIDPATKAELAAGAYPAAITGAVFNYLTMEYKKNL